MGLEQKLREKLGRPPTAKELNEAQAKKDAKKDKKEAVPAPPPPAAEVKKEKETKKAKEAKETASARKRPTPDEPSKSTAAAKAAAPPPAAAAPPQKRKRDETSAVANGGSASIYDALGDAQAGSASVVAGMGASLASAEALGPLWEPLSKGSNALFGAIEATLSAVPAKELPADERATLIEGFRERLKVARMSPASIVEQCSGIAEKERKRLARKAGGGKAKKAAGEKKEGGGRPAKVNAKERDEALAIIKRFDYDIWEASSGTSKKGYLSSEHLKQLAIYKELYKKAGSTPNKMKLLKLLTQDDTFQKEKDEAAEEAY